MRSRAAGFLVAVFVSVLAASASAQNTPGRLTGLVTDAQGAILPGVTVTATSASLIGGQSTVTQPDGKFIFPALPTGQYKLVFELSGFQKLTRENINVALGQTISIDAQLPLASLSESVTVTGASPVIDVTSTKVGTSLKGEALTAIPNSTDTWGALSEAPGVRMQGFDVGGSHKSQQSGYESFGVQNQSRVITDGVDHTEGVGGTGFYEDYFATEEVSVSALGSDVEMNSPGAAIVSTIKSGGNKFKGLENITYEPGSFVGSNAATSDVSARGYTCPPNGDGVAQCNNPNLLFWEGHADLGGPVKTDKIWFYAAYNQFKIDKQVAGVSQSVATDLGKFNNYTAKGTVKANASNTFIGYFQAGHKQKPFRNLSTLVPAQSILAQDSWSKIYKAEWQSVLSDRVFLNVNVGRFTLDWPMVPAVDPRGAAANIPAIYRSDNSQTGSGWNAFSTFRSKPQVKAQATYYVPGKAGSHDLKFGFEDMYDSYHFGINGQSGPYRLSYSAKGASPDIIRFIDTGLPGDYNSGWTAGANLDQHYSLFAQDRWAPNNRLSITGGLRFDYQDVGYKDGTRKPEICDATTALQSTPAPGDGGRIFPCSSTVAGASFFKNKNTAARLGFSYGLTGDGRNVLKAFYGRYYNNFADGYSSANPAGQRYVEYNFTDLNRNGKYDGVQELGTFRRRLGGADAPVDPNTKTPYTDEYSVTLERQFWGESSVRGTYVRKMQKDFVPFYATSIVPAWVGTQTVPVTAKALGTTYNLLDVPNSLANATDSAYTNAPDSDFTYDTLEVAFTKRIAKAFFQASGDYQWRNELRTADMTSPASSTSPLSTDPIGVFSQISVNPNAPNRQKTTMYHAQLAGHYTFAYDVGVGLNYRFQSGFPYAGIVPDGTVDLNVCQFNCAFFSQNLDQNRSEAVHLMNLRIDKSLPLGGSRKATLMLDIYNLLNSDPVTNFNLLLGPTYKTVIAVLDPRVFQMGFRFEF